jgi:hypothetical protein
MVESANDTPLESAEATANSPANFFRVSLMTIPSSILEKLLTGLESPAVHPAAISIPVQLRIIQS